MPIYVYRCPKCGWEIELIQSAPKPFGAYKCQYPTGCGDKYLERAPTAPAIRFSGSGWQTPSPKSGQ